MKIDGPNGSYHQQEVTHRNSLLRTLTLNSGDEFIVGIPKQCHFMGKMCCQMSWIQQKDDSFDSMTS